jgi:hypothetical protein
MDVIAASGGAGQGGMHIQAYELRQTHTHTQTQTQTQTQGPLINHLVFPAVCMSAGAYLELLSGGAGAGAGGGAGGGGLFPLVPALGRALCRDLLRAVRHCHAAGVVFRYLSIEHVGIDRRGRLLLTDLSGGCLEEYYADAKSSSCSSSSSSSSSTTISTPSFSQLLPNQCLHTAAPEVLLGAPPSLASSVFCAAQVCLLLLTGQHVFRPLLDGGRETSLTRMPPGLAGRTKAMGGDRLVHCQLQQQFRVLGTPRAVGYEQGFRATPLGGVYKSRLCADKDAEVECKFRLPKIIGQSAMGSRGNRGRQ